MKRTIIASLAFLTLVGNALAAPHSPEDFRGGVFTAQICEYSATLRIRPDNDGDWIFNGRATFDGFPGSNRVVIQQFEDNHLEIRRNIGGDTWQTIVTGPPLVTVRTGVTRVQFMSHESSGPDCNNKVSGIWMRLPNNKVVDNVPATY